MKKLILLGALSVLFYAVPGHAFDPESAVKGLSILTKGLTGELQKNINALAEKEANYSLWQGVQQEKTKILSALAAALEKSVKAGTITAEVGKSITAAVSAASADLKPPIGEGEAPEKGILDKFLLSSGVQYLTPDIKKSIKDASAKGLQAGINKGKDAIVHAMKDEVKKALKAGTITKEAIGSIMEEIAAAIQS